jgi:serine O-acetyltransferase
VRIGRGAVVGANAVVLESVPDHAVAVGVPAHVVRRFGDPRATAASDRQRTVS